MTPQKSIRDRYQRKIDECAQALAVRRRQDVWLRRLRVATFLPAVGLTYYGVFHATAIGIWFAAAPLYVVFMVIVRVHEQLVRGTAELRQRMQISETQVVRIDRRWDLVADTHVEVPPEHEPVA